MIDQANLLTRLADPDDAAALAAVFVDFALARPARAVIDPERVLRDLDRALAFGLVERFAETHVRGFAEREAERAGPQQWRRDCGGKGVERHLREALATRG